MWLRSAIPTVSLPKSHRATANVVTDLESYTWQDENWLANRETVNALDAPMSIYEVHLGSWQRDPSDPDRWLSYREIAPMLVEYCHRMGYTHLEFMPVSEHPFTGSWGYQPVGMFAATSRFGSPQDLMYLIGPLPSKWYWRAHRLVPAHFPKDEHGLARFDGTALYEHEDPRKGEHPDWGTMILQLRTQRSPQLPDFQRPVLARQVPHRRASCRCGGVDAVPRLQPRRGRMGAEYVRRSRELRSNRLPQEVQRGSAPPVSGRPDRGGRNQPLGRASRVRLPGGLGFS